LPPGHTCSFLSTYHLPDWPPWQHLLSEACPPRAWMSHSYFLEEISSHPVLQHCRVSIMFYLF
jgi:hypothetical protein